MISTALRSIQRRLNFRCQVSWSSCGWGSTKASFLFLSLTLLLASPSRVMLIASRYLKYMGALAPQNNQQFYQQG